MVKGTCKFHVSVTTAIPNGHTNIPSQFSILLSLLVVFWNLQRGWGSSAQVLRKLRRGKLRPKT